MTYVNHKVAVLLKELGSNLPASAYYNDIELMGGFKPENWNQHEDMWSAPDIYTAVKWIWEKYKIWMAVDCYHEDDDYYFALASKRMGSPYEETNDVYFEPKHYRNIDEAYNSGLEAACNWIKENKQ